MCLHEKTNAFALYIYTLYLTGTVYIYTCIHTTYVLTTDVHLQPTAPSLTVHTYIYTCIHTTYVHTVHVLYSIRDSLLGGGENQYGCMIKYRGFLHEHKKI